MADFDQALSVTLKRLLEINNDIRPTQIFDLNDPSSFDTNFEYFRFLANNARDGSKKYLSLATRNLCPSFPDFVIWIKQESSYYNSLSLLYDAHASRLAFDANNTPGRTGTSEIDFHSQSLSEATQILTSRIRNARRDGQDHLHVITGQGKHSHDGEPKLKPHVQNLCSALRLKFVAESNPGRIRIHLSDAESILEVQRL